MIPLDGTSRRRIGLAAVRQTRQIDADQKAGLANVFGVLLVGVVCGSLNRLGVAYGVQFMSLYAAPGIVKALAALG